VHHEWSLIPSRSAVVCCACQRALSWVSALAAARNAASLRLRSLGAWIRIGAIASLGVRGPVGALASLIPPASCPIACAPCLTGALGGLWEPVKETDTPGCNRSAAPDHHPRDRQ